MVSRICNSLDTIMTGLDLPFQISETETLSIAEAYDAKIVKEQAERLKSFLTYYVEFVLDRTDLYVKHPANNVTVNEGFFCQLERQTKALLE